jgi:hypothetical protein
MLKVFHAVAIARFRAKYPTRRIVARATALGTADPNVEATVAARWAIQAVLAGSKADAARAAAQVIAWAGSATRDGVRRTRDVNRTAILATIKHDAEQLHERLTRPEKLAVSVLWQPGITSDIGDSWQELSYRLSKLGAHWQVWISWYEGYALHEPHQGRSEDEDAAFTDQPGALPWDDGAEAVNTEIARRLALLTPDPKPLEGISSPIAINRRPDGRIGVDSGALAEPTVPESLSPEDHARALSACRRRAEQLNGTASSPQFNGRKDYGEALSAYLEWLPTEAGKGNILLADGEARVLTKLFTADQTILATGFAGRLSVLLEDHIALRAFYPEVERHYHSVRTGRIRTPLSLDAIKGIKEAIHANTPTVFEESVAPAMDETAKPVPDAIPFPDAPPAQPDQPKPPRDPIADVDPAKSRSFTFASAANRIWEILQKGKDLPQVIDGWQKTYDQFKPYIGPVIDWLKHFSGGGDGTPPMPPTLSV